MATIPWLTNQGFQDPMAQAAFTAQQEAQSRGQQYIGPTAGNFQAPTRTTHISDSMGLFGARRPRSVTEANPNFESRFQGADTPFGTVLADPNQRLQLQMAGKQQEQALGTAAEMRRLAEDVANRQDPLRDRRQGFVDQLAALMEEMSAGPQRVTEYDPNLAGVGEDYPTLAQAPTDLSGLPGFDEAMSQMQKSISRMMNAQGYGGSGNLLHEIARQQTQFGLDQYNQQQQQNLAQFQSQSGARAEQDRVRIAREQAIADANRRRFGDQMGLAEQLMGLTKPTFDAGLYSELMSAGQAAEASQFDPYGSVLGAMSESEAYQKPNPQAMNRYQGMRWGEGRTFGGNF
jgi:hypothetical protein